jgi:hypothetical protein
MPEVPLALRQGSAHELVSAKLIVLNDAEGGNTGGGIGEIRAKFDVWVVLGAFGAVPLACIPNSSLSQARFKKSTLMSRSCDLFYEGPESVTLTH